PICGRATLTTVTSRRTRKYPAHRPRTSVLGIRLPHSSVRSSVRDATDAIERLDESRGSDEPQPRCPRKPDPGSDAGGGTGCRSVEATTERRGNGTHTAVSTLHRGRGVMPAENQPAGSGQISRPRSTFAC